MGLGSWPITVALWAGGALIVFFTRQGISRDARLTIGIAAWFFLMGAAVLADSPIALAFLIVMVLMMIVPVIMKKVKAKKAAASKPEE